MLLGSHTELDQLIQLRMYANRLKFSDMQNASKQQTGNRKSKLRAKGMEFAEVRAYEPGDDVRMIDWRVTARKGKVHTKLFDEEKERPVLILLDQSPSMFFGSKKRLKSVAAAEIGTLIAWAALQQNYRIGGAFFGAVDCVLMRPKSSRSAVLHFIHQVHAFNLLLTKPYATDGDMGLSESLRQLQQIARNGTLIFVLSDFSALERDKADLERRLWQLSRHNEVTCFLISDPLEEALPAKGFYRITDGQSTNLIDAHNGQQRERHADRFQQKQQALINLCNKQRIRCASLSTVDDASAVFINTLQRLIR